jgi:repressor LexA
MKLPRTQRQKEVFDYIVSFLERRGYIPSYTQIAKHLKVSSRATVAKHIKALERLGLITIHNENGSFALVINEQEKAPPPPPPPAPEFELLWEIPFLGEIAAGQPLLVVPNEDPIAVPRFLLKRVKPENVYALKVRGDSMIDEHICDGDIALIEDQPDARDGEIVVALVDESHATLKRLYRHGPEVELRPSNSQLESIRVPADRVRIRGIFRALLRPSN